MSVPLVIRLDANFFTGLDVRAKVRDASGTQIGSEVILTETSAGFYTGVFNGASAPDGLYYVEFYQDATNKLLGTGDVDIRNGVEPSAAPSLAEITEGVWKQQLPIP